MYIQTLRGIQRIAMQRICTRRSLLGCSLLNSYSRSWYWEKTFQIGLSNAIIVAIYLSGINLSIFIPWNHVIYWIGNVPNIMCPRHKEQQVPRFNKLQDTATELGSKEIFWRTWNSLLNYNRSVNIQFNWFFCLCNASE